MITKYYKAAVGILLLFAVNTVSAQNVVNRIEVPEQEADTTVSTDPIVYKVGKSAKKTYAQERGMISRDASKTVFIPKGQWMLGGQVAWNQWNNDNLNYLVPLSCSLDYRVF